MDRIAISAYENGSRVLDDAGCYPHSHGSLAALALVQHDGEDTQLAAMVGGVDPAGIMIERALLIERDVGSMGLAHSAMRQLSESVKGPCGVLAVQGTRFPLDMNRPRGLAITPDVSQEKREVFLRVYDETRKGITDVLRRMKHGAVVFDMHTMWPWNLETLRRPKDHLGLLTAAVSHIRPDNWKSPRDTFICKGDVSKFPHVADQGLFEAVERKFRGIGLDFSTDEPFDPGRLGTTYTGTLYARKRIRALIVDVPKHELHAENREDYAMAPWEAHLSDEKIDRIGGALARAASSVLSHKHTTGCSENAIYKSKPKW